MARPRTIGSITSVAALVASLAAMPVLAGSPADAANPGTNGSIALQQGVIGPAYQSWKHNLGIILVGDFRPSDHVFTTSYTSDNPGEPVLSHIVESPDGRTGDEIAVVQGDLLDLSWSPNGKRVAVAVDPPTGGPKIFVHDTQTDTDTTVVPQDSGADFTQVSWQPTGTKIAYSQNGDIWTVDADTKAVTQVTHWCTYLNGDVDDCDNTQPQYVNPEWSPDGTKMAVDLLRNTNFDHDAIGVVNASNGAFSEVYELPDALGYNPGLPIWSPDGTLIAFEMDPPDNSYSTYTVPSSGGSATKRGLPGLLDWQACGAGCPTFGFAPPTPTSVSVKAVVGTKIKAKGAVTPAPGSDIVGVVLEVRKAGSWRLVAGRSPTLAADGSYLAKFPHPKGTSCRLTAVYEGNDDFAGSRKALKFAC